MKEIPVTVEQTLTERDFAAAEAALKYYASPMRRRSVRAGMCLTVAAVAASLIPPLRNLPARAVPVLVACAAAILAAAIWFAQPALEAHSVRQWFQSCPPAALPVKVTVFHDRAVIESKCEKITEYWTDFFLCVETDDLIAAAGGRQRFLFAVKKQGLPQETAERLSALFHSAFDGRWYRLGGKKEK